MRRHRTANNNANAPGIVISRIHSRFSHRYHAAGKIAAESITLPTGCSWGFTPIIWAPPPLLCRHYYHAPEVKRSRGVIGDFDSFRYSTIEAITACKTCTGAKFSALITCLLITEIGAISFDAKCTLRSCWHLVKASRALGKRLSLLEKCFENAPAVTLFHFILFASKQIFPSANNAITFEWACLAFDWNIGFRYYDAPPRTHATFPFTIFKHDKVAAYSKPS